MVHTTKKLRSLSLSLTNPFCKAKNVSKWMAVLFTHHTPYKPHQLSLFIASLSLSLSLSLSQWQPCILLLWPLQSHTICCSHALPQVLLFFLSSEICNIFFLASSCQLKSKWFSLFSKWVLSMLDCIFVCYFSTWNFAFLCYFPHFCWRDGGSHRWKDIYMWNGYMGLLEIVQEFGSI